MSRITSRRCFSRVIAGVDREGRVVDRRAVGNDHQDAALLGALQQPVVRPGERLAVDILLQDALAQHQPEAAPGAPPRRVGRFVSPRCWRPQSW
jgi:hypothetical protein